MHNVTDHHLPFKVVPDRGIACDRCGATGLVRVEDDLDCIGCGAFRQWLTQPESTLEADGFIGLVEQDGVFQPVALAKTIAKTWQALLAFPGDDARLVVPSSTRRAA